MVTYQPTAEARALVVTLPMARLVTIWQTNTPVEHKASPPMTNGRARISESSVPAMQSTCAIASSFQPRIRFDHFPASGVTTTPTKYTAKSDPSADGPSENGGAAR